MTRQKRQGAERPFARVVSDKQEAAATIADRRFAFALGLRCVTASADRIVGNEGSARRPTPDGCWTELFQPMPATERPVTRRYLPPRHGMTAAAAGVPTP